MLHQLSLWELKDIQYLIKGINRNLILVKANLNKDIQSRGSKYVIIEFSGSIPEPKGVAKPETPEAGVEPNNGALEAGLEVDKDPKSEV